MKIHFIFLLLAIGIAQQSSSQVISKAEYFFDTDPGIGNGIELTFSSPGDTSDQIFSIPVSSLTTGGHLLYVRSQNVNGGWSLSEPRPFFISPLPPPNPQISSAEYFFDSDPGVGAGIAFPSFSTVDTADVLKSISITGLSNGQHLLYIRTKDINGHYSLAEPRPFTIDQASDSLQIVAAEYFFDTDPGVGNGTSIATGPLNDSIDQQLSLIVPSLSFGIHYLYMRTKNVSGHWSLSEGRPMNVCTAYGADANFAVDFNGLTAYFTDSSSYTTSHIWDFGDGQTDSVQVNPHHLYVTGGVYNACLTAKSACGNDTYCKTIVANGLASINPPYGGETGIVAVKILGYGFQPGASIKLTRSGFSDILADTTVLMSLGELKVVFKMQNAPLGIYDVVLINPGGTNDTLFSGFEIQPLKPLEQWIQITGPGRIRTQANGRFRIAYGNKSNVASLGSLIILTVPGNRDLQVMSPIDTTNLPKSTRDSIPWFADHYIMFHDSITGDSTKIMVLVAPILRAGETQYLDIIQHGGALGTYHFTAKITNPIFDTSDFDSLFKVNPDTGIYVNSSCGRLSHSPCFDCILDLAGVVPGIGCPTGVLNLLCSFSGAAAGNQGITWDDLVSDIAGTILNCGTGGTFEAYEAAINLVGAVSGGWSIANSCLSLVTTGGCFEPIASRSDADVSIIGSFDPNEKFGPSGATPENYFSGNDPAHYSVFFENVPAATAPAAEVFIVDTLDASVFDVNTLSFTGFGFGDSAYYLTDELNSFSRDIDMRPAKNIILRTRGHLDGNVLSFRFSSFDPITMKLTDSIDDGFLPPDTLYPNGIGWISYSVKPKQGLPHLTELKNYANIYFDLNPAIVTPVWTNTIDKVKPQSSIDPISATQTDTLIKLTWSGSDAHAGIMDYTIYVSDNDSAYHSCLVASSGTTNWFVGQQGHKYKFYSRARDLAMNVEDEPALPDAQTILVGIQDPSGEITSWMKAPVPNPFSDNSFVEYYLSNNTNVTLELRDLLGKNVRTIYEGILHKGVHKSEISATGISDGIYFLKLMTKDRTFTQKLVVLRH